MAELNIPDAGGRRKLQSPRIDLTPMVDLGFLLITFFMFTTTLAKPKTMEINMPSNEHTDVPTKFIEESTITLIPIGDHKVIYYHGALQNRSQMQSTTVQGTLTILLNKKKQVATLPASFSAEAHKMHVLIKPGNTCKYGDVVQLLDDMNIVDVPYYAIVDVSAEEMQWLEK